ncbi:phosphatase PAP2 family protein [Streptomyces sparsogenes]|uniref:phosphatase PAP2 family protein n=1 Tax=Streptomyces sparsogenes TaxID=67365 RepID=UPI0031FDCB02
MAAAAGRCRGDGGGPGARRPGQGPGRPPRPARPLADGSGFYPSGHAATAAVAYGAALLLLRPYPRRPQHSRHRALRRALVALVALLNLAVGAGLVRRGYHWPLDVVGSWCLSGCLLGALWLVLRRTRR